ncbi:hypothetical protein TUM4249_35300 [Shewanella sp. KT0246]|nr:hypothetical protein TUM4249_35300 [Shewanella sp. KT0246]
MAVPKVSRSMVTGDVIALVVNLSDKLGILSRKTQYTANIIPDENKSMLASVYLVSLDCKTLVRLTDMLSYPIK